MFSVRSRMRPASALGAAAATAFFVLPGAAAQAALVQPSSCLPATQLSDPFNDGLSYELVSPGFALADGGSATTDPACVNVSRPAVRFFLSGDPGAVVSVSGVFSAGAASVSIPLGSVAASAGVSPPLAVNVVNMPALSGANTAVTLQFTASGGAAQIGPVWIDPWGGT